MRNFFPLSICTSTSFGTLKNSQNKSDTKSSIYRRAPALFSHAERI